MTEQANFTTQEWAATKPEIFDTSEEVQEEIRVAARAFVEVCAKHGVPSAAYAQVAQHPGGGYGTLVEADQISIARVGAPMLMSTLVATGHPDPVQVALQCVRAHFERQEL